MKNKNLYTFLAILHLFFPSKLFAQEALPELNEEFLNSLPSDVRDELLGTLQNE